MNGLDALVKIARALQRETLPSSLSVASHGSSSITLTLAHSLNVQQTMASYDVVLEWMRRNFPDGRDRPVARTTRWNQRYQHPRPVWMDWREYRAVNPSIYFEYPVEHVCINFRADTRVTERYGTPRWICVSCPKSITTTEARRRGLLAPTEHARH